MEKKKVYVPVDPKQEVPPNKTDVFTLFRQILQGGLQPDLLLTYKKEKWFDDEGEQQPVPAAWLKEQELYVFSGQQLIAFLETYSENRILGQTHSEILASLNLK